MSAEQQTEPEASAVEGELSVISQGADLLAELSGRIGSHFRRAEEVKIWQRRNTKASDERNPAWIRRCSSSVKGRIKMGVLMPSSIPHCLSPLVGLH